MNTTNKTEVEDRVWVFAASRNGVPYFSKLFTDHTELKEFSANYSDDVKGYSSTYYDLTDKTLLTQAQQQGEQIGVEKTKKEIKQRLEMHHNFGSERALAIVDPFKNKS